MFWFAWQNAWLEVCEETVRALGSMKAGQKSSTQAVDEIPAVPLLAGKELLAKMGHEFRTPLNAIIGFSQLMQDGTHGPIDQEQYAEYLRHIHDSGYELLAKVEELIERAQPASSVKHRVGHTRPNLRSQFISQPKSKRPVIKKSQTPEVAEILEFQVTPA